MISKVKICVKHLKHYTRILLFNVLNAYNWRIRSCFCSGAMFIRCVTRCNFVRRISRKYQKYTGCRTHDFHPLLIFLIQGHSLWYSSLYFCTYLFFFATYQLLCPATPFRFSGHACHTSPAVSELAATATTAAVATGIAKGSLCMPTCW